jgi:hypothetical protein
MWETFGPKKEGSKTLLSASISERSSLAKGAMCWTLASKSKSNPSKAASFHRRGHLQRGWLQIGRSCQGRREADVGDFRPQPSVSAARWRRGPCVGHWLRSRSRTHPRRRHRRDSEGGFKSEEAAKDGAKLMWETFGPKQEGSKTLRPRRWKEESSFPSLDTS